MPPSKTRFSLCHRYCHFAQRHSKSSLPSTTPCAILELYRYHSGIAQQSENSHFAQDNSRIVPILTLRRTYVCRVNGIGFHMVGRVEYDQLVKYISTWTC